MKILKTFHQNGLNRFYLWEAILGLISFIPIIGFVAYPFFAIMVIFHIVVSLIDSAI